MYRQLCARLGVVTWDPNFLVLESAHSLGAAITLPLFAPLFISSDPKFALRTLLNQMGSLRGPSSPLSFLLLPKAVSAALLC